MVGGQQHRGAGDVEHVPDPVGGSIDGDGDVLTARGGHRIDREHHLERPRRGDADRDVRADSGCDQLAGQHVHSVEQLGVREVAAVADHGDLVAEAFDCAGQQVCECSVHASIGELRIGQIHHVSLRHLVDDGGVVVGEDHRITDGTIHVGQQTVEQVDQAFGEDSDREPVEEVFGERDPAVPVVVGRREIDAEQQVDLGGFGSGFQRFDDEAGDLVSVEARGGIRLVDRQPHLGERRERLRADRVQVLDEDFEGHICVVERGEVDGPQFPEEVGERRRRIDLRAKDESVDEHADHVVERGVAAARDGHSDRDVVGGRQPRKQHREARVEHDERRDAGLMRDLTDPVAERGGDRVVDLPAPLGRHLGSRPVGRQIEDVGEVGEGGPPIVELTVQHRALI
ncbi:hypothetical protein GM1_002_01500 [Gordonia malaquae NBRC 108250]|uniref:Uncharacterized protein n=1 Tax=Gordonia malaquae NBRC 108250 TaxID=1223542 RepID=M3USF2_GORML|nr:hypothetical protein GM1_002_01500 [Gordonia malaquae NBRC 108250]